MANAALFGGAFGVAGGGFSGVIQARITVTVHSIVSPLLQITVTVHSIKRVRVN